MSCMASDPRNSYLLTGSYWEHFCRAAGAPRRQAYALLCRHIPATIPHNYVTLCRLTSLSSAEEEGVLWSWQHSCSSQMQGILKIYPNSGQSSLNTPTCPSHKLQQTPQELRQVIYGSTQHLCAKGLKKSPLNSFSGLWRGQLTAHLLP